MRNLTQLTQRAIAMLIALVSIVSCSQMQPDDDFDPVSYVYPFLDSENSRWFFFSSASRPFGMVNLSPDTDINGAWGSGYRYKSDTIKGFSHVHAWQLSALSVMPVTICDEAEPTDLCSDFYSHFSHEGEIAAPGYHKIYLDRYGVEAELTSTKRVGFHKYTFTKDGKRGVVLNLNTPLGPANNIDGVVTHSDSYSISGELTCDKTGRRPRPVGVYFEIAFEEPIEAVTKDPETQNYIVTFCGSPDQIQMKAAISYTSVENARNNMQGELAGWDFESVVKDSRDEWNSMLSRIKITTDDETAKRRFYTDLWHALQGRRVISDLNGAYPDNTSDTFRIGQIPTDSKGKPLFNQYNSDSFWGAQWTLTTLWQLVYPEIAEEFVNSMLAYHKDGGMIPRGPSGGNYTYVMTGASSTPFIVGAYQKGIRGYDIELAYEGLRKNHMLENGMMERAGYEHNSRVGGGLKYYLNDGYVPYPNPDIASLERKPMHCNGPAQTLEYAYQDWTLAQFALALGKTEDYNMFMERSKNYQNVYDTETGWMRPKDVDGVWIEDFDPYAYMIGFVEANAAQMTWYVPHDLAGLADLMGGKDAAIAKLNQQFETASELGFTSGSGIHQEQDPRYRRIPINYGNQPSIQTAFVFNHLDAPKLTQYWSRQVSDKVFSTFGTNYGYCGDEDQGLTGSLAVLYKIGLFQMDSGASIDPTYELGSPMYDKIEITLNPDYYKGGKFTINVENNSAENCYIESAKINGKEVEGYKISHKDVVNGGELSIVMTNK